MRLVIIGNGVAGITTARYVADRDASIDIWVYSQDPFEYYPRPRLIDFIAGDVQAKDITQYGAPWYQDRGIRTLLSKQAVSFDPQAQRVLFADGDEQSYDVLVLATGARQWIPPIKGASIKGVCTLRTLEDAIRLCQDAQTIKHIMILGGGLLGLDTSMALKRHGVKVTVVEALPWLLPRQLDHEGAELLQRMIEKRGVDVIVDDLCLEVTGKVRVDTAHLKSGREIQTDLVLVSAGIRSRIELAEDAGLACKTGIIVNERMQSSVPSIYAVGDVAEFGGIRWGIIPVALAQARIAAAQITGDAEMVYKDIVPSTTLQVAGIALTSLGEVNPRDGDFREIRYLDEQKEIYKKIVVRNGLIVGAILLGDRSDLVAINRLISRGIDVSGAVDHLLKPEFDLRDLAENQKTQV